MDLLESYALLDQSLIEPELRSSDAIACRFVLTVDANGKPALRAATDGLALELPVRMSRTFNAGDLVEGLLRAGFYHDGLLVAQGGALVGAGGGTTTQDGITLTFDPGAFTSSTFVRVMADGPADAPALWPELAGKGRLAVSFQVDIAGTLQNGLKLSIADLGTVPGGIQPILVARRVLEDQRLALAVGAFQQQGGVWTLEIPPEGNAILEGGEFAVVVPSNPWAWVSGTATLPAGMGGIFRAKLGAKARVMATSAGDQPVQDAVISGNLLQAASGPEGRFLLPATPVPGTQLTIRGERYDLGITGALDVDVPSSGNTLRLASIPFRVMAILPAEDAEATLGQVFTLLLSAPADPASLDKVKLMKDATEISVRRSLSLDGRTLLITPNAPLSIGTTYALVSDGLAGLSGEAAPKATRTVHTTATAPPPSETVDFTRIQLSYPDASFNVTISIPEGAVPPLASLNLEAPLMGSSYSGQMPPSGDLALTLKASLGERLHMLVQFQSGAKLEGYLVTAKRTPPFRA